MGTAKRRNRGKSNIGMMFPEPKAISGAQVVTNFLAAIAGALAATGSLSTIVTGQIGPVLSVIVGSILVVGGLTGAISVLRGNWWLERVALLVVGLGWVLLMPATLSFAFSGKATSGAIWLVVALLFAALGDIFKRYLRIQWAYLDPRK